MFALLTGCSQPSHLDSAPQSKASTIAVSPSAEPATEPTIAEPDDQWMACYVNGSKVGYTHLLVTTSEEEGRQVRTFAYDDKMTIQRFGQTTIVETTLSSTETLEGDFLRFRSEMKTGPGSMVSSGDCDGKTLTIRTDSQGRSSTQSVAWQSEWGGFFADQQSLRQKPMKAGEQRSVTLLFPVMNQPIEVQMKATTVEAVRLPSGSKQLLHIDVVAQVGQTPLESILWADKSGIVWKSKDLLLGMDALLVDREQALSSADSGKFDLGSDIVVPVKRKLNAPHDTHRIVYRAHLADDDPSTLFTPGVNQQIKRIDDHTVELTVLAVRPDQPVEAPQGVEAPPTNADRIPGAMIQSDDAVIVAMADVAAAGESDPWKVACNLERFVKGKIHLKNYETAMATAAEVAKSLEGDCTEHAVLLAALCRAKGIPARAAIGLVYYPAESGYAYHMWTEAWINDRWVPLDATLAKGGIGAAHLKFSHSSLESTAAYAELLPVVRAIGKLKLEILEVE